MAQLNTLTPRRWALALLALGGLLATAMAAAVFLGEPRIDPVRVLLDPENAGTDRDILLQLRIPRILAGALVGAALGGSGAVLQALLRNPLAYPHILGISGGAAVGGIAANLFGFSAIAFMGTTLPGGAVAAFLAALGTTFLVYRVACVRGRLEPVNLILVGVVFNSLAAALILFFLAVADVRQSRDILVWMAGSLPPFIDIELLGWIAVIVAAGFAYLMTLPRALNVLVLGDEVAASLGVSIERIRVGAFMGTSLVVGAVVSYCGMVGFVGLIIPHLFRLLLGSDHRLLLPASILGGAAFLVTADALARSVLATELPVGVLTAFCGGPFFLYLLKRHRRRTIGHV